MDSLGKSFQTVHSRSNSLTVLRVDTASHLSNDRHVLEPLPTNLAHRLHGLCLALGCALTRLRPRHFFLPYASRDAARGTQNHRNRLANPDDVSNES